MKPQKKKTGLSLVRLYGLYFGRYLCFPDNEEAKQYVKSGEALEDALEALEQAYQRDKDREETV